jgi:hypothetical protein
MMHNLWRLKASGAALLATMISFPAFGAAPAKIIPAPFCDPVMPIFEKAQGCEQNPLFVNAARKCMDKINATAAKLGASFTPSGAKGDDRQNLKFKASAEDYFKTAKNLESMIFSVAGARLDVTDYMEHMISPEDSDSEDPSDDGSSVPCYQDNHDALREISADLEKKQRDLEAQLNLTERMLQASEEREEAIESQESNPVVAPKLPSGQPEGKVPVGKGRGKSGISEREKPKK